MWPEQHEQVDNLILSGRSDEPAIDVVRLLAIHFVDRVACSHQLMVTHHVGAPGASFAKIGSGPFTT